MKPLLGGDTAPDQTGSAGPLLLDHRHGDVEIAGIERRCVTAGTTANYDYVVQNCLSLSERPSLPSPAMQTRWLLIVSAGLAVVILVAFAIWLLQLLS